MFGWVGIDYRYPKSFSYCRLFGYTVRGPALQEPGKALASARSLAGRAPHTASTEGNGAESPVSLKLSRPFRKMTVAL